MYVYGLRHCCLFSKYLNFILINVHLYILINLWLFFSCNITALKKEFCLNVAVIVCLDFWNFRNN